MNADLPDDVQAFLAQLSPTTVATVLAVRQVVIEVAQPKSERAYTTWQGIGYHDRRVGYFCGIFPHSDHVRLLFEYGRLLPDPHGVLEGTGTQTRHIVIRSEKDIERTILAFYLQAALALPARRRDRQALLEDIARQG